MKIKRQIKQMLPIFFVYSHRDLVLRCSEIPLNERWYTPGYQYNLILRTVVALVCSKTNFLYRLFTYFGALADLN